MNNISHMMSHLMSHLIKSHDSSTDESHPALGTIISYLHVLDDRYDQSSISQKAWIHLFAETIIEFFIILSFIRVGKHVRQVDINRPWS